MNVLYGKLQHTTGQGPTNAEGKAKVLGLGSRFGIENSEQVFVSLVGSPASLKQKVIRSSHDSGQLET